jgi:outer membrane protein OmpA-like peptidoglycan-associated protein
VTDRTQTLIVRSIVLAFVLGIFAYIFWPASSNNEKVATGSTGTTQAQKPTRTTAPKGDEPCLVLFAKNTANVIDGSGVCISVFAEKFVAGTYRSLTVVCRSSADGNQQDRQLLSDNRTKSVVLKLIEKGVPVQSINQVSLGDTRQIGDKNSAEGKVINRSCLVSGETK